MQFGAYFLLASVLTVLTSNDVVILTLTPIVIHFAKVTKTDPAPLLFLEFYAANTWSMALLIGCAATTAPICTANVAALCLTSSSEASLDIVIVCRAGRACTIIPSWLPTRRFCAPRRNPTNIIISEAVDLSFLAFSKWSLLPTLGTPPPNTGPLL